MYKPPSPTTLNVGQIVPCTVLGPAPARGYFVDIGSTQPALLPAAEVCLLPNATGSRVGQGWADLEPGDVYEGQIIAVNDADVNVSLAQAQRSVAWKRVRQLADEDIAINGTVLRLTDAGATVAIQRLPVFVPWSHWHLPGGTPGQPPKAPVGLIGTDLPVKFLEVDQQENRLVASNRRVQLQQNIAGLAPGQVVSGTVSAVKEYGVVVSLEESGLDGLLHISQISQAYVRNVSAVFSVGDAVRCVVIKFDAKDGSISLSTKRLEQRPGDMLRQPAEQRGE